MFSLGSFIIFYLYIILSKAFAACYWPNGTDVNKQLKLDDYRPCDGGDEESMCCALNRPFPDECRSDGLCSGSRWPDNGIWRDSCTDPTWKSPKCLKLCTQGLWRYTATSDTADMYNMDVTVTHCEDGSYCCGNGTFAQPCCDKKEGVFMVNGDAIPYLQFTTAFSTSSSTLTSLITPSSSITTQALITSSPGTFSPSNTSTSSVKPSSLSISPPGTSSSPVLSAQSASSASSSQVIAATVCGTCALLLLVGALIFMVRKFRPVQPLKSQISRHRILNLPPEMLGDDGSKELDGFREFELDRPGNYPEMPENTYIFVR